MSYGMREAFVTHDLLNERDIMVGMARRLKASEEVSMASRRKTRRRWSRRD